MSQHPSYKRDEQNIGKSESKNIKDIGQTPSEFNQFVYLKIRLFFIHSFVSHSTNIVLKGWWSLKAVHTWPSTIVKCKQRCILKLLLMKLNVLRVITNLLSEFGIIFVYFKTFSQIWKRIGLQYLSVFTGYSSKL